jgi:NAD(P)-dependent dehydrogenase (short-subunit alcohol dehydrogenase family)
MRNFVMNYSADGIRFNTVHPTGVNTPMIVNDVMSKIYEDAPDMADAAKNLLPVDMVQPGDISDAVLWLCSEEARYTTGVTLPVDGGFTVR